jgi:phosphoglycerol transferase MdoB-like AlkP superfamily enzyme
MRMAEYMWSLKVAERIFIVSNQKKESDSHFVKRFFNILFDELVDGPWVGLASGIVIPLVIVGYALQSMGIVPNGIGLLDHAIFIFLFFIIYNFLLDLESELFRMMASFLFVLVVSLFFLYNSLYYRFFHAWGQIDMFKLWQDVPTMKQGIMTLTDPLDFVFHLLVPLFFWIFSLRANMSFTKKRVVSFLSAGLVIFLVQQSLATPHLEYMESNPFFYMIRQKRMTMSLSDPVSSKVKISSTLSQYQPNNPDLYVNANDDRYPFLRRPRPDIPYLPFSFSKPPNVVLVLMESMRAYEMGAYGASPSFTPNLDRLAKEGILFKNFYAIGTQTIRGEFAVLSSYNPNLHTGPVYATNNQVTVLTLPAVLKRRGYRTHFIEADCGTFIQRKKAFLLKHGVDFAHSDVPIKRPILGFGAADEDTFDYALNLLEKEQGPFFAEIMTLSNHWTWDFNYPTKDLTPFAQGTSMYRNFTHGVTYKLTNCVTYTDHAIGQFMDKLRKSKLAENTLFIFTGDHGVWEFPDGPHSTNPALRLEMYFRSPFILWAPKHLPPAVVETIGSQLDIAPTVLDVLRVYEENSFLGTSLFRLTDIPRFLFLLQDGRWSFRQENEYVFDVGPEAFVSHPPFNMKRYLEEVKGKPISHAFFRSEKDLLHAFTPENLVTLTKERAAQLKAKKPWKPIK